MEIEELKSIWQQYDSKLDKLERLNKKLILETLSKKPQKKLDWMKYRSAYSMIIAPVALFVSLSPNIRIDNIDATFLIGCVLTLASVVYLTWINFKNYNALNNMNLGDDSIVGSVRKISDFRSHVIRTEKYILFINPILLAGIVFIGWNTFTFNTKTILFFGGLFLLILIASIIQFKRYKEKNDKIEKEILDINEYVL
jgi:uncharacterized membrane protein YgdD (TMEM256/DUF423 family)